MLYTLLRQLDLEYLEDRIITFTKVPKVLSNMFLFKEDEYHVAYPLDTQLPWIIYHYVFNSVYILTTLNSANY